MPCLGEQSYFMSFLDSNEKSLDHNKTNQPINFTLQIFLHRIYRKVNGIQILWILCTDICIVWNLKPSDFSFNF